MDRLYRRNVEDAERIRAVIFDDVSDAESIDDRLACDGDSGERQKVTCRVRNKIRRMMIVALKWALFIGNDKTK